LCIVSIEVTPCYKQREIERAKFRSTICWIPHFLSIAGLLLTSGLFLVAVVSHDFLCKWLYVLALHDFSFLNETYSFDLPSLLLCNNSVTSIDNTQRVSLLVKEKWLLSLLHIQSYSIFNIQIHPGSSFSGSHVCPGARTWTDARHAWTDARYFRGRIGVTNTPLLQCGV
jgi:hypothetical protein